MSEICRTVPNKLSSVNRILVRIDSDFIAENLQNCGLRTRPKTITVAQEVNRIISDKFKGNNIRSCRGILIPLSESNNKPGSIIIRASAYSNLTYERTAVPGIDFDETVLFEIANEIKEKCPQIGMVFYEITPNLPKTINAI